MDETNLRYQKTTILLRKYDGTLCWRDQLKDIEQILDEENVGIGDTTIYLTGYLTKVMIEEKKDIEGWWEQEKRAEDIKKIKETLKEYSNKK